MIRHFGAEATRRMPWKNGRGSTLEIASDATDGQPWTWRVSVADVPESGPFSRFEGCDRYIACVDGDGMTLTIDGSAPRQVPFEREGLLFSGDATTHGDLTGGPVRDANLIIRRDRWSGRLVLAREGSVSAERRDLVVAYLPKGEARVVFGGRFDLPPTVLKEGEGILLSDCDALLTPMPASVLLVASITPREIASGDSGPSTSAPPASA
jgi:environmental stress-induced protein Ves